MMDRTQIVFGALVVSFLVLRLVHLEADPPRVPNGQGGLELIVEAPAKAYEARKLALFGSLSTSDADAYRFWSVQAPAYVFPLAGFLSVAGVGYSQVRWYGVLVGLLGYVLLLGLLYGRIRTAPFVLVGILTCVHFYYLHYLRAGLLEPELNTWLIAMVFLALVAREDARFLFAVPLVWCAAFLTKQTAIAFLPLAVLCLAAGLLGQRDRLSRMQLFVLIGVVGLCGAALSWVVLDDAYVRTVAWNYQHMLHARESFTGPGPSLLRLVSRAFDRLFDAEHWKQGVLLVIPVCLPLILVHLIRNGANLFRRQPVSWASLLAMAWFVLGIGAVFAVEHARGRFSHVLLPPAFVIFGLELDFWLTKYDRRSIDVVSAALLVAALLATHVHWSADWLVRPTYEVRDANRELAAVLGPDDVVVGFRAPLLAFETEADIFYVKRYFNDSSNRLSRFGATHLLLGPEETTTRLVAKHFPKASASKRRLLTVQFRGESYDLYELRDPLR